MLRTIIILLFMLAVALFDWRTRKAPNWLTMGAWPLAIILLILDPLPWDWRILTVTLWIVIVYLWRWTQGHAGGGDVKTIIALGLLDYRTMPIAVTLALLIAYSRRHKETTRFLPWLALGTCGAILTIAIVTRSIP